MARPRCKKDKCLTCELEKCILDMSESEYLSFKRLKRKEYEQKRYRENKAAKIAYNKDYYLLRKEGVVNDPTYVKYVDVRKAIVRLKRKIGEVNYNLVLNEINKIDTEMFRHD